MFFVKVAIWLIMLPLTIIGFAWLSFLEWAVFLFNVPVDLWNIVSRSIDEGKVVEE